MGQVYWKPLYLTSIGMFVLSLILLPFSVKWSVLTALALITLWTRIPGFVFMIFSTLSFNDVFSFIIAATLGWPVGIGFHVFGMWFPRLFGPDEWTPYTIRATITGAIAIALVPTIMTFSHGANEFGYLIYLILCYVFYYTMVLLFFQEEIFVEIALFPFALFFDFAFHLQVIKFLGSTVSNMLTHGINSGWPFIIIAGIILCLMFFSANAGKIGNFLKQKWNNLFGKSERIEEEIEENKRRGDYSEYAEFFEDKK